jgi:glycerol-3-phosphate dehydrogenase
MRTRLFESMISMREATGTGTPHLGLGLYVARLIAEFHGGSIAASNLAGGEGVALAFAFRWHGSDPRPAGDRRRHQRRRHRARRRRPRSVGRAGRARRPGGRDSSGLLEADPRRLRYLEHTSSAWSPSRSPSARVLLRVAGHLLLAALFVMPHVPELRPRWMIRIGCFSIDHSPALALPGSHAVRLDLRLTALGLRRELRHGFVYSDCRVDDARLVVVNALDARAAALAFSSQRVRCPPGARRRNGVAQLSGGENCARARSSMPRARGSSTVLNQRLSQPRATRFAWSRASHIVLPSPVPGRHAFILQNDDRLRGFMIPYEDRFSLVGANRHRLSKATTADLDAERGRGRLPLCRAARVRYLDPVPGLRRTVLWRYAGVRPLYGRWARRTLRQSRASYTCGFDDADGGRRRCCPVFGGQDH